MDAFRNGRYEEARQAFSECYTLMPKSDVLRNLSISEIQSGHYVEAARHLTLLLSGVDLPANVREEAKARLQQAEAQVGRLNVSVDVPGSTVNPFGSVATSDPVVTLTVRGPVAAVSAMAKSTDRQVGHVTTTLLTVIPGPTSTCV